MRNTENICLEDKLKLVPELPGSYQYKDASGKIIYVGKAKNLKRRVSSYFNRENDSKTEALVKEIRDIDYIVTNNELESLVLEINLIKKYNPKYNILLKDDKTYPYIALTLDKPLLTVTRTRRKKKGTIYFGPYPNVKAARTIVDALNRIYPLRKCDPLKKDYCLYYHINSCLGYCKKEISEEESLYLVSKVRDFLNGKDKELTNKINEDLKLASKNLDYEKALEYKNLLESINYILAKQVIDLKNRDEFDMFTYYLKDDFLSINIMIVREGKVISVIDDIIPLKVNLNDALEEYVVFFYENNHLLPRELYLPFNSTILEEYLDVKIKVPKIGDKKKLFDTGVKNAKISLENKIKLEIRKKENKKKAIEMLNNICAKDIKRIELYDASHLFGSFYVGAMVVYDYLEKNKKEYRKFKLNPSKPGDVYALEEMIYREMYHVSRGTSLKPDLIIVDGGKAQIKVCEDVIDAFNLDTLVMGLAKDDKHRTNSLIYKDKEALVPKSSPLFLYLTAMQDEVHREAISFHRSLRNKGVFSSSLDMIEGLGSKRKKLILKKYHNLEELKNADIDELSKLVTKPVALKILENIRGNNSH